MDPLYSPPEPATLVVGAARKKYRGLSVCEERRCDEIMVGREVLLSMPFIAWHPAFGERVAAQGGEIEEWPVLRCRFLGAGTGRTGSTQSSFRNPPLRPVLSCCHPQYARCRL